MRASLSTQVPFCGEGWDSEARILSFVRFIYTLECSLSKGISPRQLQWSICREEHSSFSKNRQQSRSNVRYSFFSPPLNIATPPPANTQFPIRGRHKHADSTEMVGGRAKGHGRKANIEKEWVCAECFILVARI